MSLSDFIKDSTSVEEFLNLWSHLLGEKLGLICLTKNENGDVEIVGGNATARASQTETAVLPKVNIFFEFNFFSLNAFYPSH